MKITCPEDPDRCQAIAGEMGQCTNKVAIAGGKYCETHGGASEAKSKAEQSYRNYQLTQWRARIQSYAEAPGVKSLRDEIGILRMLLETTLSKCATDTDLLLQSQHLSDLVTKIERVVVSCQAMETKTNAVLDRDQLIQIANTWLDSLVDIIPQDCIEKASQELIRVMSLQPGK